MSLGKLTNIKCKNVKYSSDGKGNKLSDGGGLFLHLKANGKYWRVNFRLNGK